MEEELMAAMDSESEGESEVEEDARDTPVPTGGGAGQEKGLAWLLLSMVLNS